MPFGFGRKKDGAQPAGSKADVRTVAAADARDARPIHFRGFTEDWRLDGEMTITGRLLDLLNKREAVPVAGVRWAPIDGSAPL